MIERVPELMRRAFAKLRSGRPGPVLLEIPHSIGLRGKQVVSQPEGNAPPDFPLRHQGEALDLPQKNVNNINALKFYH